ncbi:hypothetical protein [Mycobacterium basiliense]|uniref:hypothetical protein n=1 Tax=Mycobacterium basiliense TaxID=2094119 RepID=UPI001300EB17|nr:hypothetical protein [Mycobacterium basiliense]
MTGLVRALPGTQDGGHQLVSCARFCRVPGGRQREVVFFDGGTVRAVPFDKRAVGLVPLAAITVAKKPPAAEAYRRPGAARATPLHRGA